jgi:hypothetical protein
MVTKEDLKQEIEQLDEGYLELVFRLLQQFPHLQKTKSVIDALRCSRSIDYGVSDENNEEALPFSNVDDAANFGRNLRAAAWQRENHV